MALGAGMMFYGISGLNIPETPDVVRRVNDINTELESNSFENTNLSDLEIVAFSPENQRLENERERAIELKTEKQYAINQENYEKISEDHNRDMAAWFVKYFTLGGVGAIFFIGGLTYYIPKKKEE